jgi:hypothetical protein
VARSPRKHSSGLQGAAQLLQDCCERGTTGETEHGHSQCTKRSHDAVRNTSELCQTEQVNLRRWIRQTTAVAFRSRSPERFQLGHSLQ